LINLKGQKKYLVSTSRVIIFLLTAEDNYKYVTSWRWRQERQRRGRGGNLWTLP
jgi:hypothetical protein